MSRFMEDDEPVDEEEEENSFAKPQRLVEGINLNELFSGKDVLFQFNEQYEDYLCDDFNVGCDMNDFDDVPDPNAKEKKREVPNLKLTFKELSSSMVNVDPDGYVKKEIISEGTGPVVSQQSRVTVDYSFYKEHDEESFDSTYLRGKPDKLRLGLGEMIPGLEVAIRSMKKNESSRFLIKWEVAFGKQGCPPRIGRECDILADITLLDYIEYSDVSDNNALSETELKSAAFGLSLKEAKTFHFTGNEEFTAGRIKSAIKSYRQALKTLDEIRLTNDVEEEKMLSLKVKCLVNLAVCFNKIQRSEKACLVCRDALSIDPNNAKAIFHYGKANLMLSNFDIAEKWLKKALTLKPNDEEIKNTLKKLDKRVEAAKIEDSIFCRKALGNIDCDASTSKETTEEN